jgi:FkbM family methyltransferase
MAFTLRILFFVLLLKLFSCNVHTFQNDPSVQKRAKFCNMTDATHVARFFRHLVNVDWSNCPKESWQIDMRNIDPDPDKVFVDIGFNKGYNFAQWASAWLPHSKINNTVWYNALEKIPISIGDHRLCGHCEDCIYDMFMEKLSAVVDKTVPYDVTHSPKMYGVDINPASIKAVEQVTDLIAKTHDIKLDIKLLLAAAGKDNGKIYVNNCADALFEGCAIVTNPDPKTQNIIEVPMLNLEGMVEKLGIQKRKNTLIDILLIDTEGSDAEVLKGAKSLLQQPKLIRMVSFELNENCPWPLTTLESVVRDMATMSYVCYFQGQGRLFRLTGCWTEYYEINRWSNIACVKRHDIWYSSFEKYRVTGDVAYEELRKMGRLEIDNFPEKLQPRSLCKN